jgi:SpoVK/Ycf46/Vps4 family AAA+-type ATPase
MLEEAVIRPRQRPDLYTGIRAPPRGILLYGPPGNGKTYICKALAKESGCTFFAISASSILNKLVGESEKTIKKIFMAAEKLAPSIIFIDEIDSMLTARS